jgi:hypothetical protein
MRRRRIRQEEEGRGMDGLFRAGAGIAIEGSTRGKVGDPAQNPIRPTYVQVFVSYRCLPFVSSLPSVSSLPIVCSMNNIVYRSTSDVRAMGVIHASTMRRNTRSLCAMDSGDIYDLWYGFARSKWTSVVALRSQNV